MLLVLFDHILWITPRPLPSHVLMTMTFRLYQDIFYSIKVFQWCFWLIVCVVIYLINKLPKFSFKLLKQTVDGHLEKNLLKNNFFSSKFEVTSCLYPLKYLKMHCNLAQLKTNHSLSNDVEHDKQLLKTLFIMANKWMYIFFPI